ncbi:MAG: MFS transporter [Lachnospiraceae bacterium]|nr:MFS transporter [Lachnospiraceae bacterium]
MQEKKLNYNKTLYACFVGYIVQAIVNNFVPLLFLNFQKQYGIPLEKITLLVTINFGLQLCVDLIAAGFVDKIGYRVSAMLAHGFAVAGLVLLTILPEVMADPFTGILAAVMVYAIGGGLLEVLISPIVEACPTDNKETAMSLLHSFYCWGHVGVVLGSTLFFGLFGIENWKVMACIWALVPLVNFVLFSRVPIASLLSEGEESMSLKMLAKNRVFWLLMMLMVCAGACEQAVSQWASTFAEKGLGISKTLGDLTGPMMFAIFMGTARALYGKYGEKIRLEKFMFFSGMLCLVSYLLIALVPNAVVGLAGCALCGLSVGIMWPGTFSMAAAGLRTGGTLMFALLALAGDLGCSSGPTVVGAVAGLFEENLRVGILAAVVFPVLLLIGLVMWKKRSGA